MKPPVAPSRWIDEEGPLPALMREAAREYSQNLDPRTALLRHRARRPRARRARLLVPSFVVGAILALGVLLNHFRARSPDLVARPEPERGPAQHQAEPATLPSAVPTPHRSKAAFEPTHAAASPGRASLDGRPTAEPALSASPPAPPLADSASAVGSGVSSVPPGQPAADCLGFARAGDAPKAEHCFEDQAIGQNLSAEVALYELARLRRDMLGKPAAALSALDDYARRFPHGYLSGEVLFSRLELLVKLGRSAEVLHASDELLASASGKERALEIHFLRGNVYAQALRDPANAAREYTEAARAPVASVTTGLIWPP